MHPSKSISSTIMHQQIKWLRLELSALPSTVSILASDLQMDQQFSASSKFTPSIQPIQAITFVAIVSAFAMLYIRSQYVIKLTNEASSLKLMRKKMDLELLSGICTADDINRLENDINQLNAEIEAARLVVSLNASINVRMPLFGVVEGVEKPTLDSPSPFMQLSRIVVGTFVVMSLVWLLLLLSVDPIADRNPLAEYIGN